METLKKGVPIRSSLASRESRPLNNNNEIFVFATCGRKLYRHHVGYEQHTKFTCSYSPYKWGSRQPFRNQTTTTKPIAKCKQTDSGSGCKDFNTLKIVEVINTRQSLDRHHVGYGVTLRCTHSKQKCYSSVVTNTQQILATYKIYILSVSY